MYKVLLVDDEILVREAIGKKIEWNKLGFELAGDCENGRDAVDFVKNNQVDLVLTDICMPHMDGMELSRWLYENYPHVKIIIFSGYSDFEYAKQAIQYKVSEYILKPVTAKELTEVLNRLKIKLDDMRKEERKIDKLKKVYHNYTKNEALIIAKALSRLVTGTQEVERSLCELQDMGIEIKGTVFRAVVADIDIYSAWCENGCNGLKKESALMSFVVENISGEIVEEYEAGLAYRDSDNRVCMLLWTDAPQRFKEVVPNMCREIQEQISMAMNLSVSIGIGCYVNSLDDLPKSYESAVDVLKYRYSKGNGVLIDCEEEIREGNFLELESKLREITSALRGGDEAGLMAVLDSIENWIRERYVSRNKASSYLNQVLHAIHKCVLETDEHFELNEMLLSKAAEAQSIQPAMKLTREYAQKGIIAMNVSGQTSAERQANLAMDYMQKNYGDCELGLNQICEYLNISTSRFSSIFKEATGKTFIEVLTNIRMEKAKQLLRQTSLKNYEIAEKVGFSDPHYFSIAFKKTIGMTPKEYAREKN
ncbi:response regulator [Mediterraneibacter agrestimuris]|uniref:response regulator n=1 Tax=Mediterraneibacter agrestimuris TaxID=2941333 RepID=UPI00203D7FB3|nr:response regulator [Mediterraneibacter agrestimuris]